MEQEHETTTKLSSKIKNDKRADHGKLLTILTLSSSKTSLVIDDVSVTYFFSRGRSVTSYHLAA